MQRSDDYKKLINTRKWVKLRLKKLSNNPVCEICESKNITSIANEVHHIVPVETGNNTVQMQGLCYDYNNLQSLCHACHVGIHISLKSKTKESTKIRNKSKTDHFVSKFLNK